MRIAWVVVDSLRADAPGYAQGDCHTPTLDRIAAEGVWFRFASSCAAWTVPSLAAQVTGICAHRLGLYRWEQPLPSGTVSIFSSLAAAGYRIASFVFDPDYLFVSVPEAGVVASSQQVEPMLQWLERCASPNLFVFIHVWSTHFPYVDKPLSVTQWKSISDNVLAAWKKAPQLARPKIRALYRRGVERFSERLLPRIAEALRSQEGTDGTLLIVTADHGESWGERMQTPVQDVFDLHGNHLHEEVLSVPLVLWGPGWLRPQALEGGVRTIDLAPTLAELAGGELPGAQGASFASVLRGQAALPQRSSVAFASRDFLTTPGPPTTPQDLWIQAALRAGPWKCLWAPQTQQRTVHHLERDPAEQNPLPPASGEPNELWEQLRQEWESAVCAPPPDLAEVRLRRLGYIE